MIMKTFAVFIHLFLFMFIVTGCGSGEPEEVQLYQTPTNADSKDQSKEYVKEKAAGDAFLAKNKVRKEVTTTASGLQYEVLKEGKGPKPTAESTVKVHYTGKLLDGKTFDSSVDRGEPAEFPLNGVIKGWTEGVQLMSVGSKYKFFIPTELAYDQQSNEKIKAGSTLIFEIELLEIKESEKAKGIKFLEQNKQKPGVKVTSSGLQYEVIKAATGKKPKSTDKVKVHYTGKLIDGKTFDSSVDRGQPAEFMLNEVIPGWTEGLQLMSVGSKFKFYIPSELAYGDHSQQGSPIGPGSMLIFDVELLEIKK
jgi:FKBP-type peptidyl-prolyl cis-trans isomerase